MENWIIWFLNIKRKHEKMIGFLTYILRESGGLMWPTLYGIILWRSWEIWNNSSRMILFFIGFVLTLIAIIYQMTWRALEKNRKIKWEEVKKQYNDKIVELQGNLGEFNNLFITLHQQCKNQFPDKKEIWDWDWNELTEKIHSAYRSIMDLKIT
jgi:hypothetical protein